METQENKGLSSYFLDMLIIYRPLTKSHKKTFLTQTSVKCTRESCKILRVKTAN